jgi:hypothetical protein
MQLRNTLLVAASAALVSAEDVYLVVKSDNSEINGNTLGFPHSGAGLNYAFLGTSAQSQVLDYDADKKLLVSTETGIPQSFTVGKYAGLTVNQNNDQFTFDDKNTLLVNGSPDNFYACKNTGDPYNYSERSYELMYYTADAPEGCIGLTLVKQGDAPSTTESTTATPEPTSSSEPITSVYTGAAAANYAPAGAFALMAGAAAALI